MGMTNTQQRVKFTANMGLVDHPEATKFEPEAVERGDIGRYIGPHPNPALAEQGWHLVSVYIEEGRELLCPCHHSQFIEDESP